MRAFSRRLSRISSAHPASPAETREPDRAPTRLNPEERRQREREEIAEHGRQRDVQGGESERRARVVQRVEGRGVEPPEGRGQEPDGGAREDGPDVDGVGAAELAALVERARPSRRPA